MALYKSLKFKAYGKLNLLLDIVGTREDGYHMLNTVMQTIDAYDLIELSLGEGEGIEIVCDKEGFPCDETNLIYKAAMAFKKYTRIDFGGKLTVKVEKNLPSMAGMGGGSADCAAMLKALNTFYATLLVEEDLVEIASGLGADVPFCILGGTRLCQGIGDITHVLPSPDCTFTVIKPEVSISTPEAYRRYDSLPVPKRTQLDYFLRGLASGDIYSACIHMSNVLEDAAEEPEIEKAKAKLKEHGALTAVMTGSGSAVFGVFAKEEYAKAAAEKLKDEYSYCQVCRPIKQGYKLVSVEREINEE